EQPHAAAPRDDELLEFRQAELRGRRRLDDDALMHRAAGEAIELAPVDSLDLDAAGLERRDELRESIGRGLGQDMGADDPRVFLLEQRPHRMHAVDTRRHAAPAFAVRSTGTKSIFRSSMFTPTRRTSS